MDWHGPDWGASTGSSAHWVGVVPGFWPHVGDVAAAAGPAAPTAIIPIAVSSIARRGACRCLPWAHFSPDKAKKKKKLLQKKKSKSIFVPPNLCFQREQWELKENKEWEDEHWEQQKVKLQKQFFYSWVELMLCKITDLYYIYIYNTKSILHS